MNTQTQLQKAYSWLSLHASSSSYVEVKRDGRYQHVAYVFKISKTNRLNGYEVSWYCVDMLNAWEIKQIRRICV